MVIAGGAAGKGPDSPEPPSMSVDGSSQYPSMMDEQDTGVLSNLVHSLASEAFVPCHAILRYFNITINSFIQSRCSSRYSVRIFHVIQLILTSHPHILDILHFRRDRREDQDGFRQDADTPEFEGELSAD